MTPVRASGVTVQASGCRRCEALRRHAEGAERSRASLVAAMRLLVPQLPRRERRRYSEPCAGGGPAGSAARHSGVACARGSCGSGSGSGSGGATGAGDGAAARSFPPSYPIGCYGAVRGAGGSSGAGAGDTSPLTFATDWGAAPSVQGRVWAATRLILPLQVGIFPLQARVFDRRVRSSPRLSLPPSSCRRLRYTTSENVT